MGTKVQCTSYFPGYYLMRDLNEDADSSWSRYYEDKTLSGHLYNHFLRPVDESSAYDKEMLKRTMLEHETIFRKQVYELHRLYRIQKDLMDEFQKRDSCRYYVPPETSQSNSFSSQMLYEGTKRAWQMPHLAVGSSSYSVPPLARTDDMRSPLNFLEENIVQFGRFGIEIGAPLQDSDLQESKVKRFPGRMFDLQLPADAYIDSEDADRKEMEAVAEASFRSTIHFNNPESDVKLTLGTGECSSVQKVSWKSDSHKQNGFPEDSLVDLNEPIGEICHKVAPGSAYTHFLGPKTPCEDNRSHRLPMRLNMSFLGLQRGLNKDRHSDEGCSNFLYADKDEIRRERPFYTNEAGIDFKRESMSGMGFFSPGPYSGKLPVSSAPIQLKPAKTQEILLPNNTDIWFRKKTAPDIEISRRNLASSNNSGPAPPGTPNSFSVPPNPDFTCTTSSLISALTKPMNNTSRIPNFVEGLPCFNRPPPIDVQSMRFNTAMQDSYQNGFHHHFQPDSNSAHFGKSNLNGKCDSSAFGNSEGRGHQKCLNGLRSTDLNLNQALVDQIQDGLTSQQDTRISAIEGKCHVSSGGISWFSGKPDHDESAKKQYASRMELDFSHGYPQLISSSSVVDPEMEWRQEKGHFGCHFNGFPSTSQVEKRMPRNEAYDGTSVKKILGFPILDKIQQNAICSPSHQEQSVTVDAKGREKSGLCYVELSPDINSPSLEKQIEGLVRTDSKRFRNHINLNSTEMSPEVELVAPLQLSIPSVAVKVASEIDSEAPITSRVDDTITQDEPMPLSNSDGSQGTERSDETLVREAAENVVRMSSDKCSFFCSIMGRPSSPSPCDTLKWFAEVVSSSAECGGVSKGGVGGSGCSDDGLDHFELMTLALGETKPDEYWSRPRVPEHQKDEEKGDASLLLTRPRRGQARRRRQRRDFQKDILPGLASLSKLEVTEDLQTIGGLMKASGRPWHTGLARRNAGRTRGSRLSTVEVQLTPPSTQPTDAEFQVDGRSMIGWGRTTRRCRRQRCPPVSVAAPLT